MDFLKSPPISQDSRNLSRWRWILSPSERRRIRAESSRFHDSYTIRKPLFWSGMLVVFLLLAVCIFVVVQLSNARSSGHRPSSNIEYRTSQRSPPQTVEACDCDFAEGRAESVFDFQFELMMPRNGKVRRTSSIISKRKWPISKKTLSFWTIDLTSRYDSIVNREFFSVIIIWFRTKVEAHFFLNRWHRREKVPLRWKYDSVGFSPVHLSLQVSSPLNFSRDEIQTVVADTPAQSVDGKSKLEGNYNFQFDSDEKHHPARRSLSRLDDLSAELNFKFVSGRFFSSLFLMCPNHWR